MRTLVNILTNFLNQRFETRVAKCTAALEKSNVGSYLKFAVLALQGDIEVFVGPVNFEVGFSKLIVEFLEENFNLWVTPFELL